jgi:crotonobetainyl-CoA:carnitine CoA-transferase CaiB-like acyl-CoA transferase
MTTALPRLPLDGIRVLDLSRVLAGPMCAMALADLGAEVIKVEHPKRGDDTRDWGLRVGKTETAYFNSANRNKESVCLDLDSPEGQSLARDLAAHCDVVVQNFKFGGAEKLGVGYEQIRALKPDIVYCSISGYDRAGPEAARPGYDLVIQGEAGLMAINGDAHLPPLKFGVAAVDLFTGMYSAQAVLAALFDRQRTGQGRHIEMALFDCGLMITSYYGLEALDGPLVIAVGNNAQFERFCRAVIDRPDLADDDRFKTNLGRGANRQVLVEQLNAEIGRRPRRELLDRLSRAGIPCGEVLGLLEALNSRRAIEGGLVTEQPHPVAGSTHVLAPPYKFDGQRLPVRNPPPQLGKDTDAVLGRMLGIDGERLKELREKGIV